MCGFAGVYDPKRLALDSLRAMGDAIAHRGPDDAGQWVSSEAPLGMAHRRLAVLDLSAAGHQPMTSACGRFVLVFNGEIYNHQTLRKRLEDAGSAPAWHGESDTETILACVAAWGLTDTLRASVGMFAFALWDAHSRTLTLGRDRLGEKPLYYGIRGGCLWFGSELKALRANPCFDGEIHRGVLPLLLRHDSIPAPYSIYTGISKLSAGCVLQIPLARGLPVELLAPVAYWSVEACARAPRFDGTAEEAVEELERLLVTAVQGQMMADVPLGAFLSGGVDSSTVVALMQAHSLQPVRTFSIGTHDTENDEAVHAKAVARHLGTLHTELYVGADEAMALIPNLAHVYCEPFADISQLPTLLVSQMARREVTVALSGDGADELFGGYTRYLAAQSIWARARKIPRPVRRLSTALLAMPPGGWDRLNRLFTPVLPSRFRVQSLGSKLAKLSAALAATDDRDFYRRAVSRWQRPEEVLQWKEVCPTQLDIQNAEAVPGDFLEWMMAMDARTYLSDDVLTKVDRASMFYSLETRVPFLDHRVVEWALALPVSMKIRGGQSKWPLRQVLYRYVPASLIERPKSGFGVPMDQWLRGPLREWAEDLLDEPRLHQQGYFRAGPIQALWRAHQSGTANAASQLWSVLMFQAWLRQ